MKFADPKSDIAFKKIFANENKKEILISFLNAVLDLKDQKTIMDVEILNPYQAPRIEGLKETILDVRAKDKAGITFIVEMQVEKEPYLDKRVLYYASKAYVAQIEKAEDYPKLNQVIFIGILDFAIFNNAHYLSRHLIVDQVSGTQEIKDLEFNFIELKKFNKSEAELETVIEKWVYFLKNAENLKVIPTNTQELAIQEAYETADQFQWSKEELDVYDYWSMRAGQESSRKNAALAEGEAKGRAEGKAEGLLEGEVKLEKALQRLIANGMTEQAARTILGI